MPVTFTISPEATIIFTTATGMVSCADILDHIKSKVKARIVTHAELFDARNVTLDLSVSDLRLIAQNVREAMETQPWGKVAVVTNSNFIYGLALTYATITKNDSLQLEVFQEIDQARAWLCDGAPNLIHKRLEKQQELP